MAHTLVHRPPPSTPCSSSLGAVAWQSKPCTLATLDPFDASALAPHTSSVLQFAHSAQDLPTRLTCHPHPLRKHASLRIILTATATMVRIIDRLRAGPPLLGWYTSGGPPRGRSLLKNRDVRTYAKIFRWIYTPALYGILVYVSVSVFRLYRQSLQLFIRTSIQPMSRVLDAHRG